MRDFFYMSGYGAYVWSSYAIALIVLVWNVWAARSQLREQIERAQRRAQTQREGQS